MSEQTEQSTDPTFGTRFKTALKNLGIGIVFLMAGLFLLWHNESRILEREQSITQAEAVLSEASADTESEADTKSAPQDTQVTTPFRWALRLGGWVILFLGLATLFKPLVVLVEKIPLIANFVGRGITVFALLSSLSLTLILISAVWMVARPVFGALMLVAGIVPLFTLYRSGRKARLKQAWKNA
ncbi:MAG: TMEM43 family protein [Gimesia chilikensis]|uniref:TMEM43 family protein n=1 Tax=Gimesia chilikensis TaxID=2605989 RepID=UPI003795827E